MIHRPPSGAGVIRQQILDYPLFVYVCDGTDSEKLDWFRIINIAGETAHRPGAAKRCVRRQLDLQREEVFLQDRLCRRHLGWGLPEGFVHPAGILGDGHPLGGQRRGGDHRAVHGKHQDDPSAVQLWNCFRSVIDWVQAIFPKTRREMKGLPWGLPFNQHGKRTDLDPNKLEAEIQRLMGDEDVTRKSGIYEYLLTGDVRKLSIRAFDRRDALTAYERQGHKCVICGQTFEFDQMHADHITPWVRGGKTVPENFQMLCRDCNLKKGAQE